MRPTRLLLTLTTSLVLLTILLYLIPNRSSRATPPPLTSSKRKSGLRALFSFHTPLFPPSAIISLTDDNSTFFLARPAAFGPKLPSSGLSGQLWIGSGFGEDNLGSGGRAEGELGCSDVPGWDESMGKPSGRVINEGDEDVKYASHKGNVNKKTAKNTKRGEAEGEDTDVAIPKPEDDDGTDEHLFHAPDLSAIKDAANKGREKEHADIQSLQESAEIAGKVVLLSRGGCGFLEKVKWVQRRGGKALIVGDDIRGGPLVTMYARGDTSNITVPALFTSYTTAHLLSSLIPSGGLFGASPVDGNKVGLGKITAKLNEAKDKEAQSDDQPIFTTSTEVSKPTDEPLASQGKSSVSNIKHEEPKSQHGWLRRFILWIVGMSDNHDVSRRPPGSGSIDWVMVQDFDEKPKKSSKETKSPQGSQGSQDGHDGFVIGVHDWRDPDMVPARSSNDVGARQTNDEKGPDSGANQLKGGIVTPGSGEYEKPKVVDSAQSKDKTKAKSDANSKEHDSWLSHLPWTHGDEYFDEGAQKAAPCAGGKCKAKPHSASKADSKALNDGLPKHEGLWVTLTPTNMSSSPFFDTLLVLVVSPLVTLTIVYALLLLRSRIRRRRWRAPKSVVDRLPVRTYHTIASEASTTSLATPNASSPTTPLLQPAPRRIPSRSSSRSRPRSRTTSEVPAQGTSSLLGDNSESPSAAEKREAGLAEWRRRYGGRQKECVVCLEEYVDGVSRVMSLPCGHEFHAECITPWLTTRRRTCPICKGDVVRSLQRGVLSRQSSYEERTPSRELSDIDDEDDDEVQAQVATSRNDSPSAALPMDTRDLERGEQQRQQRDAPWRDWMNDLMSRLTSQRRRTDGVDRDR
ncbi:uncharacterized protein PV09_04910 [Verruconis gallopava]|uniref:RING-type E3 ubiquitin transferase n=1 Tax=Verruconis gallopava TaxID=253628 RepID=A0A0D2ABC4_9PEZI|nr:uncharacterized protein PV09_04910 [Verruconis gallopava]KIW04093.1 hypothetical protein PV09_04910 [Verruconis gallopava]